MKSLVDTIRSELSNKPDKYVKSATDNKYVYLFVRPGTISPAEKQFLCEGFYSAGWGFVEVLNSEDKGERPGLFSIELGE